MRAPGAKSVVVRTPGGVSRVLIGPGLSALAGALARESLGQGPKRAFLVSDGGLPATLVSTFRRGLGEAGFDVAHAAVRSSERSKSLATLGRLLRAMAEARLERGEPVFALGGGVATDVAGFAAAVYRRGVPVVHAPTTLLSMVDASVGGKTGVNLDLGRGRLKKNLVGAFHQPALVLADVDALASLPARQVRSGLAECVKHGMLASGVRGAGQADLLERTERAMPRVLAGDSAALTDLVRRNVAVKAAVVAGDERELSDGATGRAILNLGHTFGHAMETLPGVRGVAASGRPGPRGLTHGEAVAVGLLAACASASSLGLVDAGLGRRVRTLLERIGLPVAVHGLPGTRGLIDAMRDDKKVKGGRLRLVLPVSTGRVRVVDDPPVEAVEAGWEAVRWSR